MFASRVFAAHSRGFGFQDGFSSKNNDNLLENLQLTRK